MGFILSILYFVTYYLTPTTLFGPLAAAHIEIILAVLISFASLVSLPKSFIFRTPQSMALIGLGLAVVLSVLIGEHWAGGAVQAVLGFIPNAFGYFLVCLHCNSRKRLQILVVILLPICLFVIAHGFIDLVRGFPNDLLSDPDFTGSPYLLAMRADGGNWLFRIRGLGEIHDPNDFGQLLVCVIPLTFIFWRAKQMLRNFVCVILPVSILLFGVYLTHSRGALLALLAVAVVTGRRRIGTVPSLAIAAGLFVALMALNFTGGRAISADAGSDRTALWGESLQLLKSHPLFGVGFADLPDYLGHTAHNSVAVCAAELGLFGLYFWCLYLFPTVNDALAVASPARLSDGKPPVPEEGLYPGETRKVEQLDKDEINRLGSLVLLALTGFLVAGWFLSRSFVMTLFILGGMVEVIFEMALQREMIAPRMRLVRVAPYSGILAAALILLMYVLLRTVNLMH